MDIIFGSDKFRKECNNFNLLKKRYGLQRAKKIVMRLNALQAANVLEDLRYAPGRCHELKGSRSGQLSLDLDGPYRLLFAPANDPIPKKTDGGLDWKRVTTVVILGVEDYHE